jgi:hypothetical protein
MRSRAPRSAETSPTINPGEVRALLGQTGRQVDPDQIVVRIPRAQIGRWYPDQREDVPVKSSVTLLTARVSLWSAGPGLVPTLSVLATCHSREGPAEEQPCAGPRGSWIGGSRRALSKLISRVAHVCSCSILTASARYESRSSTVG